VKRHKQTPRGTCPLFNHSSITLGREPPLRKCRAVLTFGRLGAAGSTVISQMLDSLAVTYLAFGIGKTMTGQVGATGPEVLQIAATGYILKFTLAILVTPVIYLSRDFLHNK